MILLQYHNKKQEYFLRSNELSKGKILKGISVMSEPANELLGEMYQEINKRK